MKWICTISMLLALALLLSVPAIAAADLHTAYLTGYPVLFSFVFRYLKRAGFFDASGFKSRSMR